MQFKKREKNESYQKRLKTKKKKTKENVKMKISSIQEKTVK